MSKRPQNPRGDKAPRVPISPAAPRDTVSSGSMLGGGFAATSRGYSRSNRREGEQMTGISSVRARACLVVCTCLALIGVSTALAAPEGGGKWETFPLTCAAETFTITASPGQWSVGHIVGENGQHVVPYSFDITVTDLDTGEILFSAAYIKAGDRGGESVLCRSYSETSDPDTGHTIAADFSSLVRILGG
jgi:hypothetical protein